MYSARGRLLLQTMGRATAEIRWAVTGWKRVERVSGAITVCSRECCRMRPALPGAVVGPWAKEKLDALERYLDFYTKVLKNQPWEAIYIDAYAGGGRAAVRACICID